MPKFDANINCIHPSPPSSMKQCNKSDTAKFHMELLLTTTTRKQSRSGVTTTTTRKQPRSGVTTIVSRSMKKRFNESAKNIDSGQPAQSQAGLVRNIFAEREQLALVQVTRGLLLRFIPFPRNDTF